MSKIFTRKWSEISGDRWECEYYIYSNSNIPTVSLEQIAIVKGGKRIPKGLSYSSSVTQYKYLRVDDIGTDNDIVDINSLKSIDESVFSILKKYEVKNNEVILSNAGTIGKIILFANETNNKVVLTENCVKILVRKDIIPKFFVFILKTDFIQNQLKQHYIQTTIPKLSIERIKKLKLPKLPSIDIQQHIIDIIDNAYKLKKEKEGEAKRLLDSIDGYLLDELGIKVPAQDTTLKNRIFTRKFSELSGDRFDCSYNQEYYKKLQSNIFFNTEYFQIKNLGELLEYIEKGIEVGSENYTQQGIPFIRVSDIDNFGINYHTVNKYISYNLYKELKEKFQPKNNELLYSKDGTIGICLKVEDIKDCIVSGAILRLVFKEELCIDFIQNFLSLSVVQKLINRESIGTVIRHLNIDKFLNLKIPVPPAEIQEKISNEILSRKAKALKLQNEARKLLEEAKYRVENIIFGERV